MPSSLNNLAITSASNNSLKTFKDIAKNEDKKCKNVSHTSLKSASAPSLNSLSSSQNTSSSLRKVKSAPNLKSLSSSQNTSSTFSRSNISMNTKWILVKAGVNTPNVSSNIFVRRNHGCICASLKIDLHSANERKSSQRISLTFHLSLIKCNTRYNVNLTKSFTLFKVFKSRITQFLQAIFSVGDDEWRHNP